jgi:aminoglycoside phosphotransferase (APT) family kinase protein
LRSARRYDAAKEAFKEAGADVENPGMDYLREWLPQALPDLECPEMTTIVHGDIRIDNMLFDENSSSVAAVVDWELSTLGHPGADLALLCSPYHTPSSMPILGGLKDLNVGELGIPDEHTFVGKYVDATGSTSLSHDLDFHLAFASFRMGSILAGVYARSIAGNASSADAQQAGKLSSFLSGMGVEHAKTYVPYRSPRPLVASAAKGQAFFALASLARFARPLRSRPPPS